MQYFDLVGDLIGQMGVSHFPEEEKNYLTSRSKGGFNSKLSSFILDLLPNEKEIYVRNHLLNLIITKLKILYSRVADSFLVVPYGSTVNGTYYTYSDIDIGSYIYSEDIDVQYLMGLIENEFSKEGRDFKRIPSARVPVLKFTIGPGIGVDISFNEFRGPITSSVVKSFFTEYRSLASAQVLLKFILKIYDLDTPYTGGIGSYCLMLMCLGYLQNYGEPRTVLDFIEGFSEFYGFRFNYPVVGIDLANGGRFFSKDHNDYAFSIGKLHIIDPMNAENHVGLNSFRFHEIVEILRRIKLTMEENDGEELLREWKGKAEQMFKTRAAIDRYYDGLVHSNKV